MSGILDLSKVNLPDIYKREGADCYYDPYRKRLVQITPEETIRQKFANYLVREIGIPANCLLTEVPISYYGEKVPGRADIVIHKYMTDEVFEPIAVIECKNNFVSLTDGVAEQAIRYCDAICAEYFIITNGIEYKIAHYKAEDNEYIWLDRLMHYDEMLKSQAPYIQVEEEHVRLSKNQLSNLVELEEFNNQNAHWVYGQDTPNSLRPFIVNLYECLMDTSHTLAPLKREGYEIVEDLGIRYMDYSDAGGGHYLGYYRAFLVKDINGSAQIVSLSLFGTDPDFRNENRRSYTSLAVAIDKYKVSHTCLQYNVDKFVESQGNDIVFLHNGQMSRRLAQPLLEIVFGRSRHIAKNGNMIALGKVANNRILFIDDSDVSEMIYNFIEYALIREEYAKLTKR